MLNQIRETKNGHQKLASIQGDAFHLECIMALDLAGFEIVGQKEAITDVGIEVDAITNNQHGIAMPWEFKGSWQGDRPGLRRTDTLKKAIANGYLLSRSVIASTMTPLLVMTTHLPDKGSAVAMLRAIEPMIVMDFLDSRDSKLLRWLYEATESNLRNRIETKNQQRFKGLP